MPVQPLSGQSPSASRLTKICNHSPLPTAPHIRLGLSAGINEHHVAKNLLNQSDFAQVGCHLTTNLKDPLPE